MKNNKKNTIKIILSLILIVLIGIICNFFIPKIIRGQKLINEINNYYKITNEYPDDKEIIANIYRKAFLNEGIDSNNLPQPYYWHFDNEKYCFYYLIGWSNFYVWEWLFQYDSEDKFWKIGFKQY